MWGLLLFVLVAAALGLGGLYLYNSTKPEGLITAVKNARIVTSLASGGGTAFVWDPPAQGSGPAYTVTYDWTVVGPDGSTVVASGKKQTDRRAPLPQPLADGTYTLTVSASNQFGTGPAAKATGSLQLRPSAPGNVVYHGNESKRGFYFSWDAASNGQDSSATVSYDWAITYPSGKVITGSTQSLETGDFPAPVTSGTYSVKVTAKNKYGQSAKSVTGTGTIGSVKISADNPTFAPAGDSLPNLFTIKSGNVVVSGNIELFDHVEAALLDADGKAFPPTSQCASGVRASMAGRCQQSNASEQKCTSLEGVLFYGTPPAGYPSSRLCSILQPNTPGAAFGSKVKLQLIAVPVSGKGLVPWVQTYDLALPGATQPSAPTNISFNTGF